MIFIGQLRLVLQFAVTAAQKKTRVHASLTDYNIYMMSYIYRKDIYQVKATTFYLELN